MNIKKDDVVFGFNILDVVELAELDAIGIYAQHIKSRAEVFHIVNTDNENLFAYSFATAPFDSSGIAHILEHSVLCGSKNYPIKDPFVVLAQGSLQTYLNAWTFPDKTVYPASSVNETDYFNLMSVYGDAVFFPLIDEYVFMQEGYRFDFNKELSITGVVYNEMKGAYSALDEYAQHWAFKSVLPDTPYSFDSGGDPADIPKLTYKEFCDFHKEKYAPANCRIFLAGNIATEKQLKFLDEKFLSKLEAGKKAPDTPLVKRWSAPRTYNVNAPKGSNDKSTIFISWLCGNDVSNCSDEIIKLSALTDILLGHDGSPLMRVLIESGLGEDIASVSGLEFELREPVWTVGLSGVDKKITARQIEELIFNELSRLVKEGIPKKEIDSALLSIEFTQKEIKRAGGGPWSLALLRRSLRGWIHNCKPWDTLLFKSSLEKLKSDIEKDSLYFENMIKNIFLDNPHRAIVIVEPKENFLVKQEAELKEFLHQKEKSLSKEGIKKIKAASKTLEKKINNPDKKEALKTIPHISVKDLSSKSENIEHKIYNAGDIPVISHNLWTNGISYCDFAFPYDVLSPDDYTYMPLFFHCITALGTVGMNYAEVSGLLAQTVGDFYAMPHSGSVAEGASKEAPHLNLDLRGRDWILFRLKALDEKINDSLELIFRIIREADFSDHRRLRDLVMELKTESDTSLAPNAHIYAGTRAAMHNSLALSKVEVCSGITQLMNFHKLAQIDISEIAKILTRIKNALFSSTGMIVSITGEKEKETLNAIEKYARDFGAPRPRNNATENISSFCPEKKLNYEIFSSPSLQVGFAAMVMKSSGYKDKTSVAELLLSHYLSTGPLWEKIRMKGGAYGASLSVDACEGIINFSTYRDPDPYKSLDILPSILKKAASSKIDEASMEKTIIGTYSKIKHPRTNVQKGMIDFIRFLYGIDDETRAKRLEYMLDAKPKDLCCAAEGICKRIKDNKSVVISSSQTAQKIAERHKLKVTDIGI
jgi:Zn-dependent M16 (insulinase) family peptidase